MQDYRHEHGNFYWICQPWCPACAGDEEEPDPPAWVEVSELPLTGDAYQMSAIIVLHISSEGLMARWYLILTVGGCHVHKDDRAMGCESLCRHRSGVREVPAVELVRESERHFIALEYMPGKSCLM